MTNVTSEEARQAGLLGDGRPTTARRVAFRDCDPFGILYNTRFLDYVMDARFDHLIEFHEMDFLKHHYSGGRMFVIVSHQASYFEPAKAHEEVLISTATLHVDASTMLVEGAMTGADGKRLKYHQWTRLKVLDPATGKASAIADDEIEDLKRTMPDDLAVDRSDYDVRMKAVLQSLRK